MRHAAAGNALMLKLATSASHNSYTHTPSVAQPAAVGMSPKHSLFRGWNGEWGRWPGPLLTVLDACECHTPAGVGNTERIPKTPHPRLVGRRCISEPASSQPG